MLGDNPILPPRKGDGRELDVVRIFTTLQGEGPDAGCPAVFVRLGGCNLACDFCDTEFDDFTTMSLQDIVEEVLRQAATGKINLIVITGGEPLRQPVGLLCAELMERGLRVQLETNGTLWRDLPPQVEIICSPKNVNGGYRPLRRDLLARVTALKFVLSAGHPQYKDVSNVGQQEFNIPVYVQPMDEFDAVKNQQNTQYALSVAQQYGYHLSLQTHKILGID